MTLQGRTRSRNQAHNRSGPALRAIHLIDTQRSGGYGCPSRHLYTSVDARITTVSQRHNIRLASQPTNIHAMSQRVKKYGRRSCCSGSQVRYASVPTTIIYVHKHRIHTQVPRRQAGTFRLPSSILSEINRPSGPKARDKLAIRRFPSQKTDARHDRLRYNHPTRRAAPTHAPNGLPRVNIASRQMRKSHSDPVNRSIYPGTTADDA